MAKAKTISGFKKYYFEEVALNQKILHEKRYYWPEEFLKEVFDDVPSPDSFDWGSNWPKCDDKKFRMIYIADIDAEMELTVFKHGDHVFFFSIDSENEIIFFVHPASVTKYPIELIAGKPGFVKLLPGGEGVANLTSGFIKLASLVVKLVEIKGSVTFKPADASREVYSKLRKIYNFFATKIKTLRSDLKVERIGIDGWKISKGTEE